MIEITHSRQDDIILVRVIGKVSRMDVELAEPEIEQALELAGDPLKVMIRLEDFEGWEIGALWEDLKFTVEHRRKFGRTAVIGERAWERWATNLAAPFADAEMRFFEYDREDEAREWLGMTR